MAEPMDWSRYIPAAERVLSGEERLRQMRRDQTGQIQRCPELDDEFVGQVNERVADFVTRAGAQEFPHTRNLTEIEKERGRVPLLGPRRIPDGARVYGRNWSREVEKIVGRGYEEMVDENQLTVCTDGRWRLQSDQRPAGLEDAVGPFNDLYVLNHPPSETELGVSASEPQDDIYAQGMRAGMVERYNESRLYFRTQLGLDGVNHMIATTALRAGVRLD